MNESFFKTPKWIKDKKEKRAEEERQRQAEKDREWNRLKEEDDRKEKEEEDKKEFQFFFNSTMSYIYKNYKECEISIPKANTLIVERHDLSYEKTDFNFKVTLDNTVNIPTFDVQIKYIKEYNYKVSGLVYNHLKNFFVDTIYEWYKIDMLYNKDKQKKQQTYNKHSNDYGSYDYSDDYGDTKTKPKKPEESEEVKNKRRRYQLLKDTLDGYNRQLTKIKEWERSNPGKTNDEKQIVLNQIDNVKDKINLMNKKFQFESFYYLKHLKSIFS